MTISYQMSNIAGSNPKQPNIIYSNKIKNGQNSKQAVHVI